mgnify:CR=1 FL=1
MEDGSFWNDPVVSQNKMKTLKSLKDDVATYEKLATQFDDIETLIEMGYEENDASLIPEIEEMLNEFVTTFEALQKAASNIGFPCVIKPVMSSSGHGQSVARSEADLEKSWELAKEARGDASELIVEEFITFDYEITMLTARNGKDTVFCEPIGHIQQDGDYIFSWQPMNMSEIAKQKSEEIAKIITDGLGGRGIFGVELFVKGDDVYLEDEVMLTDGETFEVFNVCYIIGLNGIDRVDIKLKKKN